MTKDFDEIIKNFDSKPKMAKIITLNQAKFYSEKVKDEKAILDAIYENGKGHIVVGIIADIAIIERTRNPIQDAPFTAAILVDGKWRHTHSYYPSVEYALLGAIGEKTEGCNSSFATYAGAMIGLDKMSKQKGEWNEHKRTEKAS